MKIWSLCVALVLLAGCGDTGESRPLHVLVENTGTEELFLFDDSAHRPTWVQIIQQDGQLLTPAWTLEPTCVVHGQCLCSTDCSQCLGDKIVESFRTLAPGEQLKLMWYGRDYNYNEEESCLEGTYLTTGQTYTVRLCYNMTDQLNTRQEQQICQTRDIVLGQDSHITFEIF